ncbi:Uncharacterized protein dnm_065210 [Desulfonema magnum]|uniref:Uncharacterized protein n=1 Tax=Desulfonema magnum TaxID=45655 RepID=A0A975BSW8_9BACT|nr:Uncharacterized protein dnm_065210 [Desulfonema magnum]
MIFFKHLTPAIGHLIFRDFLKNKIPKNVENAGWVERSAIISKS